MSRLQGVIANVSQTTLDYLYLFDQYSAAAYCASNSLNPPGAPITCATGNCPIVEAHNATLLGGEYDAPPVQTTYFIAVDHTASVVVASFRGAADFGYLTLLVDTELAPCPTICAACQCDNAFYLSYISVRTKASALLTNARALYPDYKVVITGHSLGAIQSALFAGELRANGTVADLVNFGMPRTGDINFAATLSSTDMGTSYRVTHTDDPAPRINNASAGFRHISPEYWIFHDVDANFDVYTGNIEVIPGYNNLTGNAGTGGFDVAAHVEYMQPHIAACFLEI